MNSLDPFLWGFLITFLALVAVFSVSGIRAFLSWHPGVVAFLNWDLHRATSFPRRVAALIRSLPRSDAAGDTLGGAGQTHPMDLSAPDVLRHRSFTAPAPRLVDSVQYRLRDAAHLTVEVVLRIIRELKSPDPSAPAWSPSRRTYRLTSVLFIVLASAVAATLIWLSPNGVIQDKLGPGQELGYMYLGPALAISLLLFSCAVVKIWWQNRYGRVAGNLLLGVSLGFLGWSALELLPNTYLLLNALGWVSFDSQVHGRLTVIQELTPQAAWLAVGLTLLLTGAAAMRDWMKGVGSTLAIAAAWLSFGFIGWWVMDDLGKTIPVVGGLGAVIFAASMSQSLAVGAARSVNADNVLVAGVSRWLTQSRVRALNVGILVGIYAAFLRPLIFDTLNYAALWEWLLGVSIVIGLAMLTGGQINKLRHRAGLERQVQEWRSHELTVQALPHETMEKLVQSQRTFVETAIKEDLLVYVIGLLNENRVPQARIIEMVRPIVNYSEDPVPRLALWGAHHRRQVRNVAIRTSLLRAWIAQIGQLTPQLGGGYVVQESSRHFQALEPRRESVRA